MKINFLKSHLAIDSTESIYINLLISIMVKFPRLDLYMTEFFQLLPSALKKS